MSLLTVSLLGIERQFQSWRWPFSCEPDARGLRLLKAWLSPAQLECYERHGYFDVIGSDSSKIYRIHHGQQANIEQLDSKGQAVCRWCFVPEGRLVAGDVMLAQKIALETYESGALGWQIALRSLVRQRMLPRSRPGPVASDVANVSNRIVASGCRRPAVFDCATAP